jgi:hypothetical protein
LPKHGNYGENVKVTFSGFDRAEEEMALLLGHVADILNQDSPACLKVTANA